MAFEIVEESQETKTQVAIKVIGVGGGGCNAVHQMMDFDVDGVELICANTDMQVLNESPVQHKLQLGVQTTRGMGAGSKPDVGRKAAEEDRESIRSTLNGADILFIAAGMGGGTGTGASPVIAASARDMGILTVAIVTKPFFYEGVKRNNVAEAGIAELKENVDCLIVIPNDRINEVMEEEETFTDSFKAVDNILRNAVYSIVSIIQKRGLINLDLNDVKTAMNERGIAMIGSGEAQGEHRARIATEKAISSPLLENINLAAARALLVKVAASNATFKRKEFQEVGELVHSLVDEEIVNVKIGVYLEEELGDTLRVTVVATGIDSDEDTYQNDDTLSLNDLHGVLGSLPNKPAAVSNASTIPNLMATKPATSASKNEESGGLLGGLRLPKGLRGGKKK